MSEVLCFFEFSRLTVLYSMSVMPTIVHCDNCKIDSVLHMFLGHLCYVCNVFLLWTPGRLAVARAKASANGDPNKEQRK